MKDINHDITENETKGTADVRLKKKPMGKNYRLTLYNYNVNGEETGSKVLYYTDTEEDIMEILRRGAR